MVSQPPVKSYFTCSLHFSKPNGRKQMILLFNLLATNSNDSTLFCGPADKIDIFSHLFLPNSCKPQNQVRIFYTTCSLTYTRNQD